MNVYISVFYLDLALRNKLAVLSSPSRLTGGWLVSKPQLGLSNGH